MSIEHANMAWAGQYQGWYQSMPVTISSNIKHKWLGGKMACYAVLCMSIEHACGFGVTTASNIKHMVYGIWPGPSSPQPLAELSTAPGRVLHSPEPRSPHFCSVRVRGGPTSPVPVMDISKGAQMPALCARVSAFSYRLAGALKSRYLVPKSI